MRRAEDGGKVRPRRHQQGELVGGVAVARGDHLLEHAQLGQRVGGPRPGRRGELGEQLQLPGEGGRCRPLADGVEAAGGADELGEVDRAQAAGLGGTGAGGGCVGSIACLLVGVSLPLRQVRTAP